MRIQLKSHNDRQRIEALRGALNSKEFRTEAGTEILEDIVDLFDSDFEQFYKSLFSRPEHGKAGSEWWLSVLGRKESVSERLCHELASIKEPCRRPQSRNNPPLVE